MKLRAWLSMAMYQISERLWKIFSLEILEIRATSDNGEYKDITFTVKSILGFKYRVVIEDELKEILKNELF